MMSELLQSSEKETDCSVNGAETWNSTQGYVPAWMGGEFGGEWIHAYEFHGQRSQAGYSPWGRKQSDTAE